MGQQFKVGDRVQVIEPADGGCGGRYFRAGHVGTYIGSGVVQFDLGQGVDERGNGVWSVSPYSLVALPQESAPNESGRKVDVLADLRFAVRFAKAASHGITSNGPRIQRAEDAIAAVAELVEQRDALLALARRVADNTILAGTEIGAQARAAIARATGESQ